MFINLDDCQSLPEAFFKINSENPDSPVYSTPKVGNSGDISWQEKTYSEVSKRVLAISSALKSFGVEAGDKVAIISQSRLEWMESDFAITSLAAVTVSVYQTLPAEDIAYILYDSETEYVFAENKEQVDKLIELMNSETLMPETEGRESTNFKLSLKKIISFEEVESHPLVVNYNELLDFEVTEIDDYQKLSRDDLASLVYTSGTTGPPKGVMQSHGNHLANARQVIKSGIIADVHNIMIFLPLAHSFAKLMGNLSFCTTKVGVFPRIADKSNSKLNPQLMMQDLNLASANAVPIVPRLLEKMQSAIVNKSKGAGFSKKLLRLTLWSARECLSAKENKTTAKLFAQIGYSATGKIREKIRQNLFGDNFMFCISGGAKLNVDVARFFSSLEIEILEGYGLTETCVATNVNPPKLQKIGTVGPVLDADIEVKILEDGEICFRGPNISKGYYKRVNATKDSFNKSGWFHTGDLGEIDEDNYLKIVGRKKDIIVTSYGKNISPDHVEGAILTSSYVSQTLLIGDNRPFCVLLLTLDIPAIKKVLPNIDYNSDYSKDEELVSFINKELKKATSELANYENPKKFKILTEEFTVENGLLTPTFKVKKKLVIDKYKDLIEDLYS